MGKGETQEGYVYSTDASGKTTRTKVSAEDEEFMRSQDVITIKPYDDVLD